VRFQVRHFTWKVKSPDDSRSYEIGGDTASIWLQQVKAEKFLHGSLSGLETKLRDGSKNDLDEKDIEEKKITARVLLQKKKRRKRRSQSHLGYDEGRRCLDR
jgi:hypothetical protein